MGSIIKTENISRSFKVGSEKIYALKNISICIVPRSLTIIRGRSGSGKTTLINLLGALDYPDTGNIAFNKRDITKLNETERTSLRKYNMGFIFQSIALVSHMTVYENMELALRIAGYKKDAMKKRVEECLSMIGLTKRIAHFPGELSGGEQQRVAIVRAISHHPLILFADEPTAELDTHTGLQVMKLFKQLVQSESLSVVMATHDPNMMEIADHVITLDDGEVADI